MAPPADYEGADTLPHVYENFLLYETRARYYLVGYTRDKKAWRVLKISRMESSELEVRTLHHLEPLRDANCLMELVFSCFWFRVDMKSGVSLHDTLRVYTDGSIGQLRGPAPSRARERKSL